jgi:plastocyanin
MKKSLLVMSFALLTLGAFATKHNVAISSNVFTPSSFSANVGDTVVWTLVSGVHDVTSTSVPSGAATISSGTLTSAGQQYSYKITNVGTYNYMCSIHGASMSGTFTAAAASGIKNNAPGFNTSAYPNPFTNKLTVTFAKADQIKVYNMVGAVLYTAEMVNGTSKIEMDLSNLASGVYFCSLYKEGVITETKKVIKK